MTDKFPLALLRARFTDQELVQLSHGCWPALLAHVGTGTRGLEIGCYHGHTTRFLLENAPHLQLTVVDTFTGSPEFNDPTQHFRATFEAHLAGLESRLTICEGRSDEVLQTLHRTHAEHFDFIYVDGGHAAATVLKDALLAWRLLAPLGVMVFDDYGLDFGSPAQSPGPAVDWFLATHKSQLEVRARGYQIAIAKKDTASLPIT